MFTVATIHAEELVFVCELCVQVSSNQTSIRKGNLFADEVAINIMVGW